MPAVDREDKKLQYYLELFAKQERQEELNKNKKKKPVEVAEGEEQRVRKKPGRKPKVRVQEEEPEPEVKRPKIEEEKIRKKPGRKPKKQAEIQPKREQISTNPFEVIDERTAFRYNKIALEIIPPTPNPARPPLAIPTEMSKPLPVESFAQDHEEWAKQFIKLI